MSNAIMENYTYNLTKVFSADVINEPTSWLANFNNELGGIMIIGFLLVFAIILFILARQLEGVKDSKAAVYSTLVTAVIALLLFFIEADGEKLLSFGQFLPFLAALALAVLIDKIMRNY